MGTLVRHGGFTRVSLLLDQCGGPLEDLESCRRDVGILLHVNGMQIEGWVGSKTTGLPAGYQIHWLLLESFVVVETWPEIKRVKAIVDLCDFTRPNYGRAIAISDGILRLFGSASGTVIRKNIETDPGVLIDQDELQERLARYAQLPV
ncbi:MAG: hypothetical protein AAB449_02205 [Patescibacteria group bacterium]